MSKAKSRKVTKGLKADKLAGFKASFNTTKGMSSKPASDPYPGLVADHNNRENPGSRRMEGRFMLNKKEVHPNLIRVDYKVISNPKNTSTIFDHKSFKKKKK